MIRLYLVRHSETTYNVEGRIQGQSDSPLTPVGVRQARAVAERLTQERFDAIYSSDLGRARATADVIAAGRNQPIFESVSLRESYFGVVQGMTHAQIEATFPPDQNPWRRDLSMRPPEAETPEQVIERCARFLKGVREDHADGSTVLAVGHGGSLRGLVLAACGIPASFYRVFPASNASLSILEIGERPVIRLWNDTSHLESLRGGEEDADNLDG